MSIIGFYFTSRLLEEAGWPKRKGFFKGTVVIDRLILDHTIDQMIDWAAGLGAGRPTLALQAIANIFRDRDWTSDDRPNIKFFIERAKADNEIRDASDAAAPHEVIQPTRFAGADAHCLATQSSKSKRPTMDVKDFKQLREPLEHWFLEGLLWGIGNPRSFETWYHAQFEKRRESLDFMRQAGLAIDPPINLPQFLSNSEMIMRNYERDIGSLPAIPDSLLADARALGTPVKL